MEADRDNDDLELIHSQSIKKINKATTRGNRASVFGLRGVKSKYLH